MMSLLQNLPFSNINNNELVQVLNSSNVVVDFNNTVYTTLNDIKSKMGAIGVGNRRYLSLIHVNIRSLVKNIGDLHQIICNLPAPPDIIAISETKLNIKSDLNLIALKNYNFIHKDSLSCAGGVGLYINKKFNFNIRSDLVLFDINVESLWINININNTTNVTVGVLYKHPKKHIPQFSEEFSDVLSRLSKEKYNCYILGDFNINFTDKTQKSITNFNTMVKSFNYHNIIKFPTRITRSSSTCIDHLYTNNKNSIIKNSLFLKLYRIICLYMQ